MLAAYDDEMFMQGTDLPKTTLIGNRLDQGMYQVSLVHWVLDITLGTSLLTFEVFDGVLCRQVVPYIEGS